MSKVMPTDAHRANSEKAIGSINFHLRTLSCAKRWSLPMTLCQQVIELTVHVINWTNGEPIKGPEHHQSAVYLLAVVRTWVSHFR